MKDQRLKLKKLDGIFAVSRLSANEPVPQWGFSGAFVSVSKTDDELSIVCLEKNVPEKGIKCERGWQCLKVEGPLDFALVGILASLIAPLASAGISIFAVSTYDTDYLLVKDRDFEKAMLTLTNEGHEIN